MPSGDVWPLLERENEPSGDVWPCLLKATSREPGKFHTKPAQVFYSIKRNSYIHIKYIVDDKDVPGNGQMQNADNVGILITEIIQSYQGNLSIAREDRFIVLFFNGINDVEIPLYFFNGINGYIRPFDAVHCSQSCVTRLCTKCISQMPGLCRKALGTVQVSAFADV